MRKVVLYVATSLDGYIARENGGVDWLDSIPYPENSDLGYGDFYAGIDITLMGNNTYKEVLNFDVPFPYPEKTNYVFTRNKDSSKAPYVEFIDEDVCAFVEKIKKEPGKNIWLVGGGQLNSTLLNANLIDQMIVTMFPIILGAGIPMFAEGSKETHFQLSDNQLFSNGLAQMTFDKK